MQAAKLFQALKAGEPCRGPSPLTPPMGLAIFRDQNKSNLAVAALISREYLPLLQSRVGQGITTPPGLFLGPRSWVQEMQLLLQRCAFSSGLQHPSPLEAVPGPAWDPPPPS